MPELMRGQTVLITGIANRWSLAYAIAQAVRREGGDVVLTYQGERVRKPVEELGAGLGALQALECDVSRDESMDTLFARLKADGVVLHGLVHSIAFAQKEDLERPFSQTSRNGFNLALDVSAYSLVALARRAAELMPEGGSIVTLSYLGATRVVTNYNVMGVAKAALEAVVRYLASELGPRQIRAHAISAGPVKTASARGIKDFTTMLDHVAARAPFGRAPEPAEIADAAVLLLSPLGRGITGDVLFVDSGYHLLGM